MSRITCKGDNFKPMLYPNDMVGYEVVNKKFMASIKLDGVRCIFKDGEMLSRSFKPFESKQLNERFEYLKQLSKTTGYIFDGEIYGVGMSFQQLIHFTRTEDLGEEKLPEELMFYCFDCIDMNKLDMTAWDRYQLAMNYEDPYYPWFKVLPQMLIDNPHDAETMFKSVTDKGYEGVILKSPDSKYKFGRVTTHSGNGYKFKPYRTYDAKIIRVEQATAVDPNAERKVTELGYHKTSRKKGDRVLIDKASAFVVEYEGIELKVSLALTDEEKEEVWMNRDNYVGRWIEYKGMDVGAKNVPRHPVLVRYRDDKDE